MKTATLTPSQREAIGRLRFHPEATPRLDSCGVRRSTIEALARRGLVRQLCDDDGRARVELSIPITGYQFLIREGDTQRWVYLQGGGGRFGDGALYVTSPRKVRAIKTRLLHRAQAELERVGSLRELVEADDPAERLRTISPEYVLDVRAVETL